MTFSVNSYHFNPTSPPTSGLFHTEGPTMTEQAKTDTTQAQLVVIEPTTAVALFTEGEGVNELLADIRQKATSLVPNISTAKGRKEIASIAYAKTKTLLLAGAEPISAAA
jgi:hypothetical protein